MLVRWGFPGIGVEPAGEREGPGVTRREPPTPLSPLDIHRRRSDATPTGGSNETARSVSPGVGRARGGACREVEGWVLVLGGGSAAHPPVRAVALESGTSIWTEARWRAGPDFVVVSGDPWPVGVWGSLVEHGYCPAKSPAVFGGTPPGPSAPPFPSARGAVMPRPKPSEALAVTPCGCGPVLQRGSTDFVARDHLRQVRTARRA
jgi:hypothetical protein